MKLIAIAAASIVFVVATPAMAQTTPASDPMPQQAPMPPTADQPTTTVTTATDSSGMPAATVVNFASPGNYTPPPTPDPASSYPVCTRRITDHCRNPGGR